MKISQKKDMAKEIEKYQGYIYYYDETRKTILPAPWIQSLNDYNHYELELHHVVPYSDWENNTKNVREIVKENCLIAIRKIMHQHLENPLYKLPKEEFEKVYGIHPDLILYDINSKVERTYPNIFLNGRTLITEEDLSCFAECFADCGVA